jgi:hypothetical protein
MKTILLILALTSNALAAPSVDELAWLAGRWTGEGFGGTIEETWNPPAAGAMIGTFRLVKDGKPVFYEFLTIAPSNRGLEMRLKHFNPDITGWEEKDKYIDFLYLGSEGATYRFEGLRYERDGDDAVTIYLAMRRKDGAVREEKLRMTRASR